MSSNRALLLKQYRDLAKNIQSLSNGQVALKAQDENECLSLDSVYVTLHPADGPYRGGKFDFEIEISDGYPSNPPTVKCQTHMYHPNIDWCDEEGDVCLNLLDELWTSEMTLQDVVQGLLFLFYNPNIEDPLSSMFMGSESEEEFLRNVRKSLRGGTIDAVEFERNLSDDYESESETEDQTTSVQTCMPATVGNSPETQMNDEAAPVSVSPEVQMTIESEFCHNIESSQSESNSGKCIEGTCVPLVSSNLDQHPHVHNAVESSVDRDDYSLQPSVAKTLVYRILSSASQYVQVLTTIFKYRNFETEDVRTR